MPLPESSIVSHNAVGFAFESIRTIGLLRASNAVEAKIKIIEQIKLNNKENPEEIIFSESLLNPKYFK